MNGIRIDLTGQTAVITGGSRGIGAAVSLLLAEAGANIVFTFRSNAKSAQSVVEKVERLGGLCVAIKAEASRVRDARKVVQLAKKNFGRVDILVNNAGIWTYGEIGKMSERNWDETIDTNLRSMYLYTNEVVPLMKKERSGRIINISSTAGQRGEALHSHYAASKAGMIGFTRAVGSELAPYNILVNAVAPGWVDTDMSRAPLHNTRARKKIEAEIPNRRVATAEDIAGAVLFLASDFSRHLVGTVISVNGGSVMA